MPHHTPHTTHVSISVWLALLQGKTGSLATPHTTHHTPHTRQYVYCAGTSPFGLCQPSHTHTHTHRYCQDGHIVDKDLSPSQSHKRIHTHKHTRTRAQTLRVPVCHDDRVVRVGGSVETQPGRRVLGRLEVLRSSSRTGALQHRGKNELLVGLHVGDCILHSPHRTRQCVCVSERQREREKARVGGWVRERGRERERERKSERVCVCVCMCRDTAADTTYCICTLDARCFTVL